LLFCLLSHQIPSHILQKSIYADFKCLPSHWYGTQHYASDDNVHKRRGISWIACHWSISWTRWIQSTTFHPIALRSIQISSSHLCLGLPSGLFPSGFPAKTL
jgi:hypothetical protein